jgi:hypothetical protein
VAPRSPAVDDFTGDWCLPAPWEPSTTNADIGSGPLLNPPPKELPAESLHELAVD